MSVLILIQTVCKGYQQTTRVAATMKKELTTLLSIIYNLYYPNTAATRNPCNAEEFIFVTHF